MIIRHFTRQQGRRLARAPSAWPQVQRRCYAHETEHVGQRAQDASGEHNAYLEDIDPETSRVAERYNILQHHNATSGSFGATVGNFYKPHEVLVNPPSPSEITPELLLASQAHMGHATSLWNPMNSRFIHGAREGIHIISLEETAAHLRRACRVVSGVAERGGLILFAGTKRGQETSVVLAARLAKGFHLFNRWMPGSITNKEQILGPYKLKMVNEFDKEIVVNPEVLRAHPAVKPDLVVCLNPMENWVLLHECGLNNIPTVGIIDTDADPTWVTYPIPANDDSLRCTNLIAGVLGRAGEEGQRMRMRRTKAGDIPYESFDLPKDNAIGDIHKRRLDDKPDGGEPEPIYQDEAGEIQTKEWFAEQQRQGVKVDDSMMTVYMDGDGGDVRDEWPYVFKDDGSGEPVREHMPKFALPSNAKASEAISSEGGSKGSIDSNSPAKASHNKPNDVVGRGEVDSAASVSDNARPILPSDEKKE